MIPASSGDVSTIGFSHPWTFFVENLDDLSILPAEILYFLINNGCQETGSSF